jgi:CopA family copper-resistance protein
MTGLGALLALALAPAAVAGEYDLVIDDAAVRVGGRTARGMTVNGAVPGPTLHWREGEEVVIRVRNDSEETTSVHWHGLLLPGAMDGVPGMNGFEGIRPGETFTYRFTVRQAGTYWYHSHSGFQEQAGVYGPIVIAPADMHADHAPGRHADRDYVVMLSDFTTEDGARILNNLKVDPGYYNDRRRTLGDFVRDARRDGLGATLAERAMWGGMRMDPTDIADVAGYSFLVNGAPASANETFVFAPGERVRLQLINGSAMTYFDVRIPGLKMTVIAADGRDVEPVTVDELRIAVAETYDVIVAPADAEAYTVFAESIDRSGHARATLAVREGLEAAIPAMRPRALLTMADMGMSHAEHAATEDVADAHAGHAGALPMDHAAMGHDAATSAETDAPATDASGRTLGWGSEFPPGADVLDYADLRSAVPQDDLREPGREIRVVLGGNMERYIWTLDGKTFPEAEPIRLAYGERAKLTFVNETMMAHPMHLHGMFVQLENGQPTDRLPDKHVVNVPPGQSYSVLIAADEPGEWALHCHLLFHMASGMMNRVVVAHAGESSPSDAPMTEHDHSAQAHGGAE